MAYIIIRFGRRSAEIGEEYMAVHRAAASEIAHHHRQMLYKEEGVKRRISTLEAICDRALKATQLSRNHLEARLRHSRLSGAPASSLKFILVKWRETRPNVGARIGRNVNKSGWQQKDEKPQAIDDSENASGEILTMRESVRAVSGANVKASNMAA